MAKRLTKQQDDGLGQIHHSALELCRLVLLCAMNRRVGREWWLKMSHAHEYIGNASEKIKP